MGVALAGLEQADAEPTLERAVQPNDSGLHQHLQIGTHVLPAVIVVVASEARSLLAGVGVRFRVE